MRCLKKVVEEGSREDVTSEQIIIAIDDKKLFLMLIEGVSKKAILSFEKSSRYHAVSHLIFQLGVSKLYRYQFYIY